MRQKLIWQADKEIQGYSYALFDSCESEIEELMEKISTAELLENLFLSNLPLKSLLEKTFKLRNSDIKNEQNKPRIYSLYCMKNQEFNLVGMGGIFPLNSLGGVAEIWFLSESMGKHSRFLVCYSSILLEKFLEQYPVLVNVVASWNRISIKWLKRLGFYVEPKPCSLGAYQALFHRFYITQAMHKNLKNGA